jgi:hypothetical protein
MPREVPAQTGTSSTEPPISRSASPPSPYRSKIRPPTRSSKTTSTISSPPIEWHESVGHHVPISRVKTSNARPRLQFTTRLLRIAATLVCVPFMLFSLPSRPPP